MNLNEYKVFTRTTAVYPKEAEGDYLTAGLVGEVGELYSAFAKYHRNDYDVTECYKRVEKEMGDILWFWVRLCDYYGFDPDKIIQGNVNKLQQRMKAGTIRGEGDER